MVLRVISDVPPAIVIARLPRYAVVSCGVNPTAAAVPVAVLGLKLHWVERGIPDFTRL